MKKTLILLTIIAFVTLVFTISCKNNPTTSNLPVPELTTSEVSSITDSSAVCGGAITSDGGATVTTRGVCWGTTQTPTISDNHTTDGDGAGTFTSEITGLTPETKYYVRAYATNSAGTGYGSTISFLTLEDLAGTLTDIDGNTYKTIKIGNQVWMAENLKVTRYRNGDAIPNVTDNTEWSNLSTGAYCSYDNSDSNIDTYGLLYNWYAINDSRNIAPDGWHVPTDEEWKQLEMYLGMSQTEADDTDDKGWRGTDEGGKLKEAGTTHWKSPNAGATNSSGFKALPGGYRYSGNGAFLSIGGFAYFWSASELDSYVAWSRKLSYKYSDVGRDGDNERSGFSVRCVRD